MSVWASIPGDDPVIYDSAYGQATVDGFLDVAVSCLDGRVRIIATSEGKHGLSLNREGLTELHRRIVQARNQLNKGHTNQ